MFVKQVHRTSQSNTWIRIAKGLQLKLTLNAIDQDNSLVARIEGIIVTAELEKLANHYEELTKLLNKMLEDIQSSLSPEEERENHISRLQERNWYLTTKIEVKERNKMKQPPSTDKRINKYTDV